VRNSVILAAAVAAVIATTTTAVLAGCSPSPVAHVHAGGVGDRPASVGLPTGANLGTGPRESAGPVGKRPGSPAVSTGRSTGATAGSAAGTRRPARPPAEPVKSLPCARPSTDWNEVVASRRPAVEGYTSIDSAVPGTDVGLYISATAARYRIQAYRMGYYGHAQACLVWTSAWQAGRVQQRVKVVGATNTPTAPWSKSMTMATKGWDPGVYLLRIDGGSRTARTFMPLVMRSPSFAGRTVLVMPDTTWQAYNSWGGYSLYDGPRHSFKNRSRAVPFDRPYDARTGAADLIPYELPFVALAEKIGIPLGYASDVDLQRFPTAFLRAHAIISVGHDEYYSPTMRETLTTARDHGVNLAFFGGNDVYRKIRFANTANGADRLEINYKDATDPIKTPSLVTTQWRETPSNNPESSLTGADYRCASSVYYPMVVADPTNWLFTGTGVQAGTKLPGVVGQEFDGINIARPVPRPLTVLFHSPVICTHRPTSQDSTYYTTPSGAGVLDIGAYYWNCAIARRCPAKIDGATSDIVTRITTNFLTAAAAGPLGKRHPAVDNVRTYYPRPRVGN